MKVVHINFWDKRGGAAIAANRLHKAMINQGIDSKMLVFDKFFDDGSVIALDSFFDKLKIFFYNVLESRLLAKFRPFVGNFSISFWGLNVSKHSLIKDADIIYLHWVNNDFISISTIDKILRLNKPVFWFLHDMWPITGGCHHSFGCVKYTTHCQSCDLLKSVKVKDVSYRVFNNKKNKISSHPNLNIIAPSIWLGDCAKNSALFSKKRITVIPNSVDTNKFKKINKIYCRKVLGLPLDKKIILFGADLGTSNPYKGWSYLRDALKQLNPSSYLFATFGGEVNEALDREIAFPMQNIGRLFDDYSLTLLYNASDVFVIPSLAEAFGQTALESISCGTPVVGFDVGGIPDIVKHKTTGYLANYKDSLDLKEGITWVLEECNYEEISNACISLVESNFCSKVVVNQHISLIHNVK